jgi:signal transduction histidine kinase
MKRLTISLQNRLTLIYTLFISAALALLALAINHFTGVTFNRLIKQNINEKNAEIVRSISELYDPFARSFDGASVETIGMLFVHEGYIVSVEDSGGGEVWDARSCDMQQCRDVISGITARMEKQFRVNGGMQRQEYPVSYYGQRVGTVIIESYGPYFYSETETRFLSSVNRLLLTAGLIISLLCAAVSAVLSRAIARPVNRAGEAARGIAQAHSGGGGPPRPEIRIPERYFTRELAELSASINLLAAELEEAERRQRQLSSDIAHELRTPLTCLQGNIEAMMDGVYEAKREHLQSCHEEIMRLSNLVHDLSALDSLEWENLTLYRTSFDLAELLQAVAEQFMPAAAGKGVEVRLSLRESPINADRDRLKQVFINLLSNAVKYTERGSISIAIREIEGGSRGLQAIRPPAPHVPAKLGNVAAHPPQRGETPGKRRLPSTPPATPPASARWEVTVADTGAGIPRDELSRIFERLYRADKSRSRGTGGAGIGLTIAAAIVRAHGGTILAESPNPAAAQNGSVFHVYLPET